LKELCKAIVFGGRLSLDKFPQLPIHIAGSLIRGSLNASICRPFSNSKLISLIIISSASYQFMDVDMFSF
jgi:hypothetical protein